MNQLIAAIEVDDEDSINLSFQLNDPRFQKPLSGLYWQIDKIDSDGDLHVAEIRSRSLWDQVINSESVYENHYLEFDSATNAANNKNTYGNLNLLSLSDKQKILTLVKTVLPESGSADFIVMVAVDKKHLDKTLFDFYQLLLWLLGVLVILLSFTAWVLQVFSLKPLNTLHKDLEQVKTAKSKFLSYKYPSEIQPLVEEFNQVLKNNADFIEQARAHAGNLAHALKTPLSVMANASQQSDSEFAQLVDEQVNIAKRHVDHHLARAKAIAAFQSSTHSVEVLPAIQEIERVLTRINAEKNVKVDYEIDGDVNDETAQDFIFRGEKQDLQEILGNVLENAFKWTKDTVFISLKQIHMTDKSPNTKYLQISIEDNGLGIESEEKFKELIKGDATNLKAVDLYDLIFQRGIRLDEKITGSGLGMSIVLDLVNAYAGQVKAEKSKHGGLAVHITLPSL